MTGSMPVDRKKGKEAEAAHTACAGAGRARTGERPGAENCQDREHMRSLSPQAA